MRTQEDALSNVTRGRRVNQRKDRRDIARSSVPVFTDAVLLRNMTCGYCTFTGISSTQHVSLLGGMEAYKETYNEWLKGVTIAFRAAMLCRG